MHYHLRSRKNTLQPNKQDLVTEIRQAMFKIYNSTDTNDTNDQHLMNYFELCMTYIHHFNDSDAFRLRLQNEISNSISDVHATKYKRRLRLFQKMIGY